MLPFVRHAKPKVLSAIHFRRRCLPKLLPWIHVLTLDGKADRLAKFSISIVAVLVAALKIESVKDSIQSDFFFYCSIASFTLAALYAIRAQAPINRLTVPSIASVATGSQEINAKNDWLASSYHMVVVGNELFNQWMGQMVSSSLRMIGVGIVLVLLSVCV